MFSFIFWYESEVKCNVNIYKERYEKVKKILEDKELDAILVSNGYNMRYLSGFSGATGHLYLSKNKQVNKQN